MIRPAARRSSQPADNHLISHVIDMHRVTFIDCAAVSAILDAFAAASQIGIPMHLINARGIVLSVFELIGVPELFDLTSNDRGAKPDR